MDTIPLDLDGYTDLPAGRIANMVTYLERKAPLGRAPEESAGSLTIEHIRTPDADWYRDLYWRVGLRWLWFSRAVLSGDALSDRLARDDIEVHALRRGNEAVGFAELDLSVPCEIEIAMFGVVPDMTGTGAARFLMERVISRSFGEPIERLWLHTCSFDHPAALPFYRKAGFVPYKFAIEVAMDPRLSGLLPRTAGPHVPLIEPSAD